MKLLEKILLATDFSQASNDALQTALFVAKAFNSEITLIHVIKDIHDSPIPLDTVKNAATEQLHEMQADIKKEGIEAPEPVVAIGTPFDQIVQHASHQDVNVIMVGSGEKMDGERFRLGVTAERVIRNASKPVWIVKHGAKPLIKNILCPVDFSEPSARALTNSIHLSRHFKAELNALTVIRPMSVLFPAMRKVAAKEQEAYAKQEQAQFDRFLQKFDFHNVNWNKVVRQGRAHQEILAFAKETQPDLLVMGSVGRTGLERILMGSVAEKIIREMPCSVITVKSEHAIRLRLEAEIANIEVYYKQGIELLEEGLPLEAMRQFEGCIAKDAMFAPAWEGLAVAHKRLGHDEESEKCQARAKYIRQSIWARQVEAQARRQLLDRLHS